MSLDDIKAVLLVLISFVVLFALFLFMGKTYSEMGCEDFGKMIQRDAQYYFTSGCYVNIDGIYINTNTFKPFPKGDL